MYKIAKIVMLPTEKASNIVLKENVTTVYKSNRSVNHELGHKNQLLYLLSDENIEIGDWFYADSVIVKAACFHDADGTKNSNGLYVNGFLRKISTKVIASSNTDLILPSLNEEFLRLFCQRGGVEEVKVKYTSNNKLETNFREVIVRFVEPDKKETFTREEVIALIKETWNLAWEEVGYTKDEDGHDIEPFTDINDFIEENL